MNPLTRTLLATAALLAAAPAAPQTAPRDLLPDAVRAREDQPPAVEAPATPAPGVAAGEGPSFELRGVELEGATVLGAETLAPIWAELIGSQVTLPMLEEVAARIGARYRAEGYVLSQALLPAQTVQDGIVRIAVIEGFVDRVGLEGGAPAAQSAARQLFAPVAGERPLRLSTLERSVLLARDTLGGSVETVLAPSPCTFGAAELTALIEPKPVDGFASLDSRGSRLYGDGITATAGLTAWGPLGLNKRWDLLAAGAPSDGSLRFGQLSLELPLFALDGTRLDGARLALSADTSRARPDLGEAGSPDELVVTLDEINAAAALIVPFIRTREQNLFGRLGVEWRRSRNRTGFAGQNAAETDEQLTLAARLTWDRADRVGGVSLIGLELRQGLDFGPAELDGIGDPSFTLAGLSLTRLQRLGQSPWSLWAEAIGQIARAELPNSERFALGGATIGRGFAPGNATGDSGYGARLELRRGTAPEALGGQAAAELYAFGDWGEAYDRDDDRNGERRERLASVGIGARIDVRPWLTLTPEIARQVRGVPTDRDDPDRETRFFIGAIARF